MSLWTPGGEHPVDRNQPSEPADGQTPPSQGDAGPDILAGLTEEQRAEFDRLSPEEQEQAKAMIAQMAESRQHMAETPAAVVVANHAMGLYELAAIHLGADAPKVDEAKLAIDALAGVLDAVGDQMGEDGTTLRDALAQIQLAYVQVKAAADAGSGDPGGDDGS
ncbi:MAG: hypothetical protein U5K29_01670 [Acidimicrobiales bacterium]|nr:hypothetical protein [Acidimicrobiales bacterium]